MSRITVDDDIPGLLRDCEEVGRTLWSVVYEDPAETPDRNRILRGALRQWMDEANEQISDHEKQER